VAFPPRRSRPIVGAVIRDDDNAERVGVVKDDNGNVLADGDPVALVNANGS
jgi:uncharacterized Zn ribbon protein